MDPQPTFFQKVKQNCGKIDLDKENLPILLQSLEKCTSFAEQLLSYLAVFCAYIKLEPNLEDHDLNDTSPEPPTKRLRITTRPVGPELKSLTSYAAQIATLLIFWKSVPEKQKIYCIHAILKGKYQNVGDFMATISTQTEKIPAETTSDHPATPSIVQCLIRFADWYKDLSLARLAYLLNSADYNTLITTKSYNTLAPYNPLINTYVNECVAKLDKQQTRKDCYEKLQVNKVAVVKQLQDAIAEKQQLHLREKNKKWNDNEIYECYTSCLEKHFPSQLQLKTIVRQGNDITLHMYKGCVFDVVAHSQYPQLHKLKWSERLRLIEDTKIELSLISGLKLNQGEQTGMIAISYYQNERYHMKMINVSKRHKSE